MLVRSIPLFTGLPSLVRYVMFPELPIYLVLERHFSLSDQNRELHP